MAPALGAGYRWFESIHPEFFTTKFFIDIQFVGENKDVYKKKAFSENNERKN